MFFEDLCKGLVLWVRWRGSWWSLAKVQCARDCHREFPGCGTLDKKPSTVLNERMHT
jgi:hypothetical protein